MLKLNSEYGNLKSVLIHKPGKEIDRLTPDNASTSLFSDTPFLEEMQREHQYFAEMIEKESNAKVYYLTNLLADLFEDRELLTSAFSHFIDDNLNLESVVENIVDCFSIKECSEILVSGLKSKELKKKLKTNLLANVDDHRYIIKPSPNLYFMRDPAAVVQAGVISSQMYYPIRQREANLMKNIFQYHPDFSKHYDSIYPNEFLPDQDNIPPIEGGDVLVISKEALAIGKSDRTIPESIKAVAKSLFTKNSNVKKVYEVHLPENYMHLDTIFTMIDEDLILAYSDPFEVLPQTRIYHNNGFDNDGNIMIREELLQKSLLDLLKKESPDIQIIKTAGTETYYSSKEQKSFGANIFTLQPRKIIIYQRNKHTIKALTNAGVNVIPIRGSELVRGLGGPRCMTMPLDRESI